MKKKESWMTTLLRGIGLIIGSYFIGAITLVFIKEVGGTLDRRNFEVWEWVILSLMVGGILLTLWNALTKDKEKSDG